MLNYSEQEALQQLSAYTCDCVRHDRSSSNSPSAVAAAACSSALSAESSLSSDSGFTFDSFFSLHTKNPADSEAMRWKEMQGVHGGTNYYQCQHIDVVLGDEFGVNALSGGTECTI